MNGRYFLLSKKGGVFINFLLLELPSPCCMLPYSRVASTLTIRFLGIQGVAEGRRKPVPPTYFCSIRRTEVTNPKG